MQIPRAGSMQILRLLQSPPEGKSTYRLAYFESSRHRRDPEML